MAAVAVVVDQVFMYVRISVSLCISVCVRVCVMWFTHKHALFISTGIIPLYSYHIARYVVVRTCIVYGELRH